jgi:transposase
MTTDEKLDALINEIADLRRLLEGRAVARHSPQDVLSLDEAAVYVGVAASTLRDGKAGTRAIPRLRDRPVQFLRGSLDEFKRARVEREVRRMKPRRMSLVRRKGSRREAA